MHRVLILTLLGLMLPHLAFADGHRKPGQCANLVECTQAMVAMTNRLAAENNQLRARMQQVERQVQALRQNGSSQMRRGAVRVEGSGNGYRETTIVFKPPFRGPPVVFLSARDVNIRDHQQLWVKSISNDRAVIANCRRHRNPESCGAYADDFHFDWVAMDR